MTGKEHPLLKTHPHLKDFVIFLEHLNRESERGQVLISAAMLDDLLMQTIQAFLIKGDSANIFTELELPIRSAPAAKTRFAASRLEIPPEAFT